jgi:hypothetical protein
MTAHVEFVAMLMIVGGALTTLVGLSSLALGLAAAALFASAGGQGGGQFGAGLTALTFLALALIAILWGLLHIVVGVPLRRRRHWSRLGALMLGSVDLALVPFGTALGAYALWVLLSEDGKRLFAPRDV